MVYLRPIRIIIIKPLLMISKWQIKGDMLLNQEAAILKLTKIHLSAKKRVKRAPYHSCPQLKLPQ